MEQQDIGDATELTQGFDFEGRVDQMTFDKSKVA